MRSALLCLCLVGCPGSRSQPVDAAVPVVAASSSATATAASVTASDGGADANAVALADCFEPSRVTQLGTIKNEKVVWDNDLVSDGAKHFDPETLAAVPPSSRAIKHGTANLLVTGERVEQSGTTLIAGARKLPKLEKGESFERVESGRWIVATSGDVQRTLHVIDGLAGKKDARAYVAVRGDLAAWEDPTTMGVTVSNLATHATVLKDAALCTAGGIWDWSLSSRYLWCNSNRGGSTGYDLQSGKTFTSGNPLRCRPTSATSCVCLAWAGAAT